MEHDLQVQDNNINKINNIQKVEKNEEDKQVFKGNFLKVGIEDFKRQGQEVQKNFVEEISDLVTMEVIIKINLVFLVN